MKRESLYSAAAVAALLFTSLTLSASPRDTVNINFGWQFGRERGKMSETVDLPHDFQIAQPWVAPASDERADTRDKASNVKSRLSSRGFKEMGEGWYEYRLTPDSAWRDRRVLLDFQGIMLVGDVYLNGKRVGGTDYGYLGFEVDISKRLKYGAENLIEVSASTGKPENSRWYTGGGLFRDVNIIVTDGNLYFPRHPLYIRCEPSDDYKSAEVKIQADIYYGGRDAVIPLKVRILDAAGNTVAERDEDVPFNRVWRHREYELEPLVINNPSLWDLDSPYLYTAELTLADSDKVTERFGVRKIEFSPAFGMKLNGRKVLLKGMANHHTLGALGAAAYPRAIEKRIELIKAFGYNHIRTSHNPYSEDLLRLCDTHGILVVDELYDKWLKQYSGGRASWESLWQENIPEFIKRDRNHPSVVMWSLGNELQTYSTLPFNDWGVTAYKLQRSLLHKYDTTRLVTVAMHPRGRDMNTDSLPAPLAMITDVQAYNYRYMYFPGDSRRFPWMMFYQSEASTAAMGQNFFEPANDKVIGLAYWGPIDYLGESGGWPAKGWAQGVFDLSLQPKPVAYLVKSMFLPDQPTVHIGIIEQIAPDSPWNGINVGTAHMSENWNREEASKVSLYTYTNADEVELFVNGRSMGVKQNSKEPRQRNKIKWDDIPYEAGYIEAVARTGGKETARHRLETTGEAAALTLEPDNASWKADGMDLEHVRVTAVDKKGRRVYAADEDLLFSVSGDARIVAVDNGDITSDELHTADHRHLFNGSALVILRAGRSPGSVTLTVSGEGYKTKTLKMKTR